jgi:hypothetical protein
VQERKRLEKWAKQCWGRKSRKRATGIAASLRSVRP